MNLFWHGSGLSGSEESSIIKTMQKEKKSYTLWHTFNQFTGGILGGFTQVLLGQPFDTIKVRLQASIEYQSIRECINRLIINEGPEGFFKGALSPLLGTGLLVSLEMGGNEVFKRLLKKEGQRLSNFDLFLSGMMAGFVSTVIAAPVEHGKIRMQMQVNSKGDGAYHGSVDALKKIYHEYGVRGVYQGLGITLLRELVPTGVYYMVYDIARRHLKTPGEVRFKEIFPAGAIAGFFFWLVGYPLDLVKTRIQYDDLETPRYKGLSGIKMAFIQVKTEGIKKHWPGFEVCMIRSVPVYGGCFYIFEKTIQGLSWLEGIPLED